VHRGRPSSGASCVRLRGSKYSFSCGSVTGGGTDLGQVTVPQFPSHLIDKSCRRASSSGVISWPQAHPPSALPKDWNNLMKYKGGISRGILVKAQRCTVLFSSVHCVLQMIKSFLFHWWGNSSEGLEVACAGLHGVSTGARH